MLATAAVTCHPAEVPRCLGVHPRRAPDFSKPGKSKAPDQSPVFHASLTLMQVIISCLFTRLPFHVDSIDATNIHL